MSGPDNNNNNNNDDSDDEHHVNKENATPTKAAAAKQHSTEVRIRVGGVSFLLDQETLQKLNSEYWNKKIAMNQTSDTAAGGLAKSPPSVQQQQQDSPRRAATVNEDVFVAVMDDADAECFSALVHMVRYGTLPTSIFNHEQRELLLFQADAIWGIRAQVEAALEKARADFRKSCDCAGAIQQCIMQAPMSSMPSMAGKMFKVPVAVPVPFVGASSRSSYSSYSSTVPTGATVVCLEGPHHNYRRGDGSRRVFCSSCGHRDIDWRYQLGDFYSNCMKCNKDIMYKPDLGWCHKCRMCDDCQTSECPGVPIRQLEEQVIPYMMATLKNNESALSFL